MAADAPSADELRANPIVKAAFAAAWADSFADDPALRHEERGYIYVDPATGEVAVRRSQSGTLRGLDRSFPPELMGSFLVATYHTHPNPISEGNDPDPSPADVRFALESGVPWFVVSEVGVVAVGPERRVGGMTGPPGYPL